VFHLKTPDPTLNDGAQLLNSSSFELPKQMPDHDAQFIVAANNDTILNIDTQ
jgi:hypothetical protein